MMRKPNSLSMKNPNNSRRESRVHSRHDFTKMLIISIIVFALLTGSARALTDNFYFTIPPDSSGCLAVRLPIDLNTLVRDYYTLETSSDLPVNLRFVKTFAEALNVVKVPLCFYSSGRKEGDFSYYTIKAGMYGLSREFKGGICISETRDMESREAEGRNPCELINGYEDLFYISFLEPVQWALPGTRINYTILVQSMKALDIGVKLDSDLRITPGEFLIRTPESGRADSVSIEVLVPASGEHEIKAMARVVIDGEYCDIPFCLMEAETRLIAGSKYRQGFDFFVFPPFLSSDFSEPVLYTLFIENFDEERGFDIRIEPPEGIEPDWVQKTVSIKKGERRELEVNITPLSREAESYTIRFTAGSEGIEKTQEVYLSVREIESDILRRWDSIRDNLTETKRRSIELEVDRFIDDYRVEGLDFDEYKKIDTLLKEAEGFEPPQDGGGEEPQPLNPLLIAIPIIIIILVLIILFYRRSRPLETGEEWSLGA